MTNRVEVAIQRLKEALGALDDEALAIQLQRDVGTLRVWESRQMIPTKVILGVAQATGCSVDWLSGEPDAPKYPKRTYDAPEGSTATVLNAREAALLANYRAATEDGRKALEATSAALAKPEKDVKERRGRKAA